MPRANNSPGVNPETIIDAHYPPGTKARAILLAHGRLVAAKALDAARRPFFWQRGKKMNQIVVFTVI